MVKSEWKSSRVHYDEVINQDWTHVAETNIDYHLEKIDGIVELIIQCTADNKDWHVNLNYYPTRCQIFGDDSGIYGHEGFYWAYLSIRQKFLDLCYQDDVKEIRISGYSYGGGGITQIAFQDAMYHLGKTKRIIGISYEGPRVFCPSRKLSKMFKENKDNCQLLIVTTFWDPVVHCPPKIILLPFIELYFYPFHFRFVPSLNFSVWKQYGKKIRIGKWWKIIPIQHLPSEIEKNLLSKFGC